jgi:hypothetical protein
VPEAVVSPGVGWSFQQGFGDEKRPKSLVAQLHVPLDMSAEEVDKHLDKVRVAIDRQIAIYDLESARGALQDHKKKIRELHTVIAGADESARIEFEERGRRGEWTPDKLTPQQRQAKAGAQTNLERYEQGAEFWQLQIQELERKVSGHAPVSGANSHTGGAAG